MTDAIVDVVTGTVWPWLAGASIQMAALACLASLGPRRSLAWVAVLICPFVPALTPPEQVAPAMSALGAPAAALRATSDAIRLMAVAVWAAGAAVSLAMIVRRGLRVRAAWLAGSRAPETGIIREQAQIAARLLGVRRMPLIAVRSSSSGPAVVGVFPPVIVVPASLASLAAEDVRHVLLHEMAHVQRRDPLAAAACVAMQAIFWFHPAAWIARLRLSVLREIACDARATSVCDRPAYRRTLARLAAPLAAGMPPGALALFSRPGELITRLRILDRAASKPTKVRTALAAFAMAALVACSAPMRHAVAAVPDVPAFAALQGSMQKRFAIYGMLAHEAQVRPQ
jgi:beta-lactamase regulating signal transducer with metallopeptidase domain